MNEKEYIEYIENYTSDANYEGLHMLLELRPNLIKDTYPLFVKLTTGNKKLSTDRALQHIIEDELAYGHMSNINYTDKLIQKIISNRSIEVKTLETAVKILRKKRKKMIAEKKLENKT